MNEAETLVFFYTFVMDSAPSNHSNVVVMQLPTSPRPLLAGLYHNTEDVLPRSEI